MLWKEGKMHQYGVDDVRDFLMEGVLPEEVSQKTKEWCIRKFRLISKYVVGRRFKNEVFEDPENYFGKLVKALAQRLKHFGLRAVGFKIVKAL